MSFLLTLLLAAAVVWAICAVLKITFWVVVLAVGLLAVFHLVVRQ